MARAPENFPDEVESDRNIQPLAAKGSRLSSIFFIIAAVGALVLLLILQIFSDRQDAAPVEREVFRPITSNVELPEPPRVVEPLPTPKPVEELKPIKERFNPLELERLRQVALLEQQKLELERKRLEAIEAERTRRLKSDIVIMDTSGATGGRVPAVIEERVGGFDTTPFGFDELPDPNEANEIFNDGNERFLRDAGEVEVAQAVAVKLENQETLVTQGTFISGVLETAINSDLPGLIRAVVDKNVYGRTGELVVIPKGSRLIGRYRSGLSNGQARVFVVWSRVERPDGVVAELGSPGTDRLGVAGLDGYVDTHFVERFGAATFLSVIGPAIALLVDEAVGTTTDQTDDIIDGSSDSFSQAATIALENSISRPPTVHVDQGKEITIFVNRDISFHNVGVPSR